jgi:hypothetical protein
VRPKDAAIDPFAEAKVIGVDDEMFEVAHAIPSFPASDIASASQSCC